MAVLDGPHHLNHGRMARATPELSPLSAPHQREGIWLMTSDITSTDPIHAADLQWNHVSKPRNRDLSTRPPWPPYIERNVPIISNMSS
ncbi:hypothetical protein AVEN_214447-1 [Araneus ventricosus]|uniref:Uncharacterized protein n=1 Tax=Araneus ventricosus TaxID=182803 RepID=A0A4Y2SIJ3_ARAVE|nr:hypothetical protein AVEN_214447-1 [Araneus ventricosus]